MQNKEEIFKGKIESLTDEQKQELTKKFVEDTEKLTKAIADKANNLSVLLMLRL